MFITDEIGPLELVSELLCGESVDESATAAFSKYRHNNDLCPGFRNKILRVLSTYQKHRIDVYDIQGFQDKGVDVAIRVRTDDGMIRIGLQLKSDKEIVDWKAKRDPDFISKLRNQYAQARQEAKVDQLYLVLCGDAVAHRDHLRTITSNFVDYEGLKIISPEAAFAFFSMTNAELDVAVTKRLCARDFLLLEARRSLKALPPGGSAVAISLIFRALGGETALTHDDCSELIFEAADEAENDEPELLLQAFIGGLIYDPSFYEDYRIVPDSFPAICALYYDQFARYGDREAAKERTRLLLTQT
jgi:hypothetical protein